MNPEKSFRETDVIFGHFLHRIDPILQSVHQNVNEA